jgi:hypothetical protein
MVIPEFNYYSVYLDMTVRGFNSEPTQSFSKTDKWIRPAPRACACVGNDSVVLPPHMRCVKKKKKLSYATKEPMHRGRATPAPYEYVSESGLVVKNGCILMIE